MLLSAVIYVTAVTALLAGAAWILESAVKGRDIPTRFIWAFVICAAIASLGLVRSAQFEGFEMGFGALLQSEELGKEAFNKYNTT